MGITHAYTQTVADGTATSVVRPSDWNSAHVLGQALSGNTAGQTSFTGTNIVFQGGNNVTLSGNTAAGAATIVFSAAGGAQSYQPMAFSASGGSSTANTLTFANSNGLTFSNSNGSIIGSYTVPSVPAQSQQPIPVSASNGSTQVSTVTFANSNGMSFATGTQGIYASYTVPNVPAQSQQPMAFSASGGSSAVNTLTFANSNGITFSNSNGSIVASYTVPSAGAAQTFNIGGNTLGQSSLSNNPVQFVGGNNVTLSADATNITISAAAQTNQSGNLYAIGNTTGTSSGTYDARSLSISAVGGISAGASNGVLFLSYATGAEVERINIGGNTSGQSSVTLSDGVLSLFGGNNITLSANGQSLTISGQNSQLLSYYQFPQNAGATFTSTAANATVYLQPFDVQEAFSAYRLLAFNSMGAASTSFSVPISSSAGTSTTSGGSSTASWGLTRTVYLLSRVSTGTNASSSQIVTFYSSSVSMRADFTLSFNNSWQSTGTNTIGISSTVQLSYLRSIGTDGGVTYGTSSATSTGTVTLSNTTTTSSASFSITAFSNMVTGARPFNMPFATSLAPGEYWMGLINSTTSSNMSVLASNVSLVGMSSGFGSNFIPYGNTVAFSSSNYRMGHGSYSATSNLTATSGIPLTAVSPMSQYQTIFNLMAQSL